MALFTTIRKVLEFLGHQSVCSHEVCHTMAVFDKSVGMSNYFTVIFSIENKFQACIIILNLMSYLCIVGFLPVHYYITTCKQLFMLSSSESELLDSSADYVLSASFHRKFWSLCRWALTHSFLHILIVIPSVIHFKDL